MVLVGPIFPTTQEASGSEEKSGVCPGVQPGALQSHCADVLSLVIAPSHIWGHRGPGGYAKKNATKLFPKW